MQIVRSLPLESYDENKGRFSSEAFKLYEGGISVFEVDCAVLKSGSICDHIRQYLFSSVKSTVPFYFWVFPFEQIKDSFPSATIDQESKGDNPCHWDIRGIERRPSEKYFKKQQESNEAKIYKCHEGKSGRLTIAEIETIKVN